MTIPERLKAEQRLNELLMALVNRGNLIYLCPMTVPQIRREVRRLKRILDN